MEKIKFMLCRYPAVGFGQRSGMFYFLDVFGNRYDICDTYDDKLDVFEKTVTIDGRVFCDSSVAWLIKKIEVEFDTRIKRWCC